MKTSTLLKRFVPYYRNYVGIMIMDLFCAALTTVCELVLPLILRYITNLGMNDLSALTVRTIVTILCCASSTAWPAFTWLTRAM